MRNPSGSSVSGYSVSSSYDLDFMFTAFWCFFEFSRTKHSQADVKTVAIDWREQDT